jgi:hypothetical protein
MAGTWSSEQFPQFEKPLRSLVEQHLELKDEPLHLAISYGPPRDQEDIFLFELIGGLETVSPDKDLLESTFEAVPALPNGFDRRIHLVLTYPLELKQAIEESWPLLKEILGAIRANEYKVLHKDALGERMLKQLRAAARRMVEAAHG